MLMCGRFGGDNDKYDKEGDQRHPEGDMTKYRKGLAVAVEQEREGIYDLVADKHVPRMDCTDGISTLRKFKVFRITHKSG